jgi:hypothetical protein
LVFEHTPNGNSFKNSCLNYYKYIPFDYFRKRQIAQQIEMLSHQGCLGLEKAQFKYLANLMRKPSVNEDFLLALFPIVI